MTALLKRIGKHGKRSAELPILFENYLKVVKLNVFTGEFYYVKTYRDTVDKSARGSFYEHAEKAVASGLIHSDDAKYFMRYFKPDYLSERLSEGTGGKRIVLHGLRYRVSEEYETVDLEMIASKSFSPENPWAVLCITCPENCRSSIETAVTPAYLKIISVRISDGSYEPIYMTDSEISTEESLAPDISRWFKSFAAAGNVEERDRERFLSFASKENLLRLPNAGEEAEFSYRRLIDGKFRPAVMKVTRHGDRTFIYIYESDIGNKNADNRRKTEAYYDSTDILTGIGNRKSFDENCGEYDRKSRRESIGVLYARLPRQREEDIAAEQLRIFAIRLMEIFGRKNCYRTGEREFAVISAGSEDSFIRRSREFAKHCSDKGTAIGICTNGFAESISLLYETAAKEADTERV